MPEPFEPKGLEARWRTLYRLLQDVEVGGVLTYAAMAEALDLDVAADRHTMQLAMRRASKELETVDKHATEAVPNVGYRVVLPPEHLGLAKLHQRKMGRSLDRSRSKVTNVDYNEIDDMTRTTFELVGRALGMQQEMLRRLNIGQHNLEKAVTAVKVQQETDMEKVNKRLEWLEEQQAKREGSGPEKKTGSEE